MDRHDVCPYCGRDNDAATEVTAGTVVGGGRPTPGDVSVCFSCAGIAMFTSTGVRAPTEAERAKLLTNELVVETAGHVLLYRAVQ